MQFFKRIELWILLAGVMVGLFFVFRPHGTEGEAKAAGAGTSDENAPVKIYRCTLERDYGNARLDIEMSVRNDGAEKLVLQPPKVRLLNAKDKEVSSFFLPFQQQPEVAAKSTQDVELRYWLEAGDLAGALKLDIAGRPVEIKSARSFDLNSLKNSEKKVFDAGAW